MKLKITKFTGEIECEIVDGSLDIDDVRRLLLKPEINAKNVKSVTDKYIGKLPIETKMPI